MLLILLKMLSILALKAAASSPTIAKPGCRDDCGGTEIPYPFGIGDGCYYNRSSADSATDPATDYSLYYKISCDDTTPTYGTNINLLNITLSDHTFRINNSVAYDCYTQIDTLSTQKSSHSSQESSLSMVRFNVSPTRNKFVATGCDTIASIQGNGTRSDDNQYYYFTGCNTYCTSISGIVNGNCSGVGCCETDVPSGTTQLTSNVDSYFNHTNFTDNPCSSAFVVENGEFEFSTAILTSPREYFQDLRLPMVFDWLILGSTGCGSGHAICGGNTECVDRENGTTGYWCNCLSGFSGNPYLLDGCQDVDECQKNDACEKPEYCTNNQGGYTCKCDKGFHGNATKDDPCIADPHLSIGIKLALGIGISFILLLVGGILTNLAHQKKKLLQMRQNFFINNGGLVLNRELRGRHNSVQKFRMFTVEELEKATECFSEANVVGRGGFGKVYRGTLPNGQLIAIKRSLKVDSDQVDQFVNETLVLSEINNKNVVKLLGCCLETEVPSLVYEFISNGTLYEHLHDELKASRLSWETRLSIAESVASVLSYLHTTISIPIIHRDMKSMNILLDENYTAKVSDFGASKLVPTDQDQLATVVLGTCGYLDPEYMQTHELTQKSDVYSFGVVLVELLTRRKAIRYDCSEAERSLAMLFLSKMKEDRLLEIVDGVILMSGEVDHVREVAVLARRCLRVRGEERPTMREVAMELESIRKKAGHSRCDNATTMTDDYQVSLMIYPVGDDKEGYTDNSITSNIPTVKLLPDLGEGR